MANSEGSGAGMGFPMAGQTAPFAPFEMWMEWFKNNMGNASATPGAGVPWLMSPGISTGEEELPEGAVKNDPLMSAMQKAWEANPVSSVIPIDWIEITRALQTLWMREMSDPVRATQVAADYNRRFVQASMEVWQEAEETANGQADTEEQRRLKFHLRQFVEAMAPVNFFLTNPAAIKRAIETGGTSLVDGARNLMSDLEDGSLSMVDSEAFEVGENLATTPGKVVYRNRLMELIQYEPRTEQVYETPILFIPPWINKYYIVDLSPENSFVRYMLEQGFQFFMISWKNPDASMADVKFEDYMHEGPLEAVDVALEITGAEKVNPIGYCIGGNLLGLVMGHLAAGGAAEGPKI